jgi:hypothetical protein
MNMWIGIGVESKFTVVQEDARKVDDFKLNSKIFKFGKCFKTSTVF